MPVTQFSSPGSRPSFPQERSRLALGVEHLDLGLLPDVDVAVAVERDAGRRAGGRPFAQELAVGGRSTFGRRRAPAA